MPTEAVRPKTIDELRSQRWFASDDIRGFAHRQRMQQQGLAREEFMGRPVIGIVNTWSELSPCHAHLRERAEAVKRGVLQAGGYPLELPALSLGEVMVKPTTMLYRNLLSIECEELLRSLPIDGAVLMGGCDKTTPGLIMGALSMDIPAIFLPAGPMMNDRYKGQAVGAGTHTKKFWAERTVGNIDQAEWIRLESRMTRTPGTCNTMGTASTMTAIAEAMGLSLPGAMSIPAVDSEHSRMAWRCGQRIVSMVWEDLKPSRIVTKAAFLNAVTAYMALGGLHQRGGAPARDGGAGGHRTEHRRARRHRAARARHCQPVSVGREADGKTSTTPAACPRCSTRSQRTSTSRCVPSPAARWAKTSRTGPRKTTAPSSTRPRPLRQGTPECPEAGIALAVLRGNLCPDGAVIKPSAATPALLRHTGRALVFDSNAEMLEAMADDALDCDASTVLVLRNGGPVGGPGMPEWGNLPIPKKLLKQGVRDMLRISDSRMSGTHYGTCVLHVSPESAIGGPLALLKTGDTVRLDIGARSLDMLVPDEELAARRAQWKPPVQAYTRGFTKIFQHEVTQAHLGCDFASLAGNAATPEPPIY
jgi:dihydroxyacid dehydratase/phosphogluconate dehydratase